MASGGNTIVHPHRVVFSSQEAIKEESYFPGVTEFVHGDLEGSMEQADGILEGEFDVGGQEHFYLETHTCLVRPGEDQEMEVHATYQTLRNLQV